LLLGVVNRGAVEIGAAIIPAREETVRFRDGQSVKLVFRPEDVHLSPKGTMPDGCRRLANGIIDQISFVASPYVAGPYVEGAYEIALPVTSAIIAALKPEYRSSFEVHRQ